MKNKKVLIIDDEADFGLLLKNFFEKKNYDAYVSCTLNDGMEMLESIEPDFIFLDNNLPDGFGWSKVEYILNKYPRTHLHLISAYNVPKTSSTTFQILEKPIGIEDLNRLFL